MGISDELKAELVREYEASFKPNAHGVLGWEIRGGVFIPRCCIECCNYDSGELGDYGERLSGPWCERNVFWPTKKGTCVWQNKRMGG